MMNSIRRNLPMLLDFSGREDRSAFWPYAAAVLTSLMAGVMAVMLPAIVGSMLRVHQFAAAHADQATVTEGPGSYSVTVHGSHPEFMPDFGVIFMGSGVLAAAAMVLLAAAISRRLHDSGRSAAWGFCRCLSWCSRLWRCRVSSAR